MIAKHIFKTYDIRGLYPSEVNKSVALKIGLALGRFFGKKKGPKIVIARDGRIGSPELYRSLIKGLKKENPKLEIVKIGLATTPLLYFTVQNLKAAGGIIVTASHNPKEWNGFKIVGRNAEMISGKDVLKMVS